MRRLTLFLVVLLSWSLADGLSVCADQSAKNSVPPSADRRSDPLALTHDLGLALKEHPENLEQHAWDGNQLAPGHEPLPPAQNVGNQYATHVLATLERHVSVIARIRHRVHLGEYSLIGSGQYWQQGVGNQRKTRLVLKTQIANQTASLIQVFDGRYLWTDQQLPSGRQVTRFDSARMQDALTHRTLLSEAASRGSFCGQMADLVRQFDFGDPQTIDLNGTPRVALIGRWKAAELERIWPHEITAQAESSHTRGNRPSSQEILSHWPTQLPHHALLLVGPQNLYPYLIEYRLAADAPLASASAGRQPANDPLARYEQFDVHFAAQIDDRLFELAGRDIDWTDESAQRIKQLQTWSR